MTNDAILAAVNLFGTSHELIDADTSTKTIKAEMMDGHRMLCKPAKEWLKYPHEQWRLFLHEQSVYVAPTEELIDYLDNLIGDDYTIEICAGCGNIGRQLDITMTDSYLQAEDPMVIAYYQAMNQPLIKYPRDVKKMEAVKAVQIFHPHTVLGCYAMHKHGVGGAIDGNYKGVDFMKIYEMVHRIILVGNTVTHANNPLLKLPHEEIQLDGLLTRAADQSTNRIFIWQH
jgi:hypothetical protein